MAIERLALFALSIAYTVSVVALPSLPADIPPRAGFDGPFVGAPLMAFLLPVTATAMWRLLETLARPAATWAPRAMNNGAGVAIFLVVFHVTMLMGFIGGLASAGRILGMVVGVFLMLTANELPRLRLAGPWRAGTMRLAVWLTRSPIWASIDVVPWTAMPVAQVAGMVIGREARRTGESGV